MGQRFRKLIGFLVGVGLGYSTAALAYTVTTNIGLKIPSAGDTDYPTSFSDSFTLLDVHNHAPGKGLPIGTTALVNGSVTTAKLADTSVTNAKLDPAVTATFSPPGVVVPFAGDVAPAGWLLGDGSAIDRLTYASLFAVVGVRFGFGDGSTTFNLPDCRGRVIRFADGGAGRDPDVATRTAMNPGGAAGANVGSIQGDATKLPNTSFTTNNPGDHAHGYIDEGQAGPNTYEAGGGRGVNAIGKATSPAGSHSHTVTGGGDAETRMKNFYLNCIVKY